MSKSEADHPQLQPSMIDFELLKSCAASIMGSDVVGCYYYSQGADFTTYTLFFDPPAKECGYYCCARLTKRPWPFLWFTQSEISTQEYVTEKTTIPIPKIYHYKLCTGIDGIGAHVMFMEHDAGYPLYRFWGCLKPEHKIAVADQLASVVAQLANLTFGTIGSIKEERDKVYSIGPISHRARSNIMHIAHDKYLDDCERNSCEVDTSESSPAPSSSFDGSTFDPHADRSSRDISPASSTTLSNDSQYESNKLLQSSSDVTSTDLSLDQPSEPPYSSHNAGEIGPFSSAGEYLNMILRINETVCPPDAKGSLAALKERVTSFFQSDESKDNKYSTFGLLHPNLHDGNVIFYWNPKRPEVAPKLKGVLDWEFARTYPRCCIYRKLPPFLRQDAQHEISIKWNLHDADGKVLKDKHCDAFEDSDALDEYVRKLREYSPSDAKEDLDFATSRKNQKKNLFNEVDGLWLGGSATECEHRLKELMKNHL